MPALSCPSLRPQISPSAVPTRAHGHDLRNKSGSFIPESLFDVASLRPGTLEGTSQLSPVPRLLWLKHRHVLHRKNILLSSQLGHRFLLEGNRLRFSPSFQSPGSFSVTVSHLPSSSPSALCAHRVGLSLFLLRLSIKKKKKTLRRA